MAASRAAAHLRRAWKLQTNLRVEVHLTEDIVSQPPRGRCDVLVNAANEELVGTKLPYFPMAVEPPPELRSSKWCAMEIGNNMFYPMQVVDGRVHALGGQALRQACAKLPEQSPGIRCAVGNSVVTEAYGDLCTHFAFIVHTVPPMYQAKDWAQSLSSCWQTAIAQAFTRREGRLVVAAPLLGAGARGAPVEEAAQVAVEALTATPKTHTGEAVVCLAVREEHIAEILEDELSRVVGLPIEIPGSE